MAALSDWLLSLRQKIDLSPAYSVFKTYKHWLSSCFLIYEFLWHSPSCLNRPTDPESPLSSLIRPGVSQALCDWPLWGADEVADGRICWLCEYEAGNTWLLLWERRMKLLDVDEETSSLCDPWRGFICEFPERRIHVEMDPSKWVSEWNRCSSTCFERVHGDLTESHGAALCIYSHKQTNKSSMTMSSHTEIFLEWLYSSVSISFCFKFIKHQVNTETRKCCHGHADVACTVINNLTPPFCINNCSLTIRSSIVSHFHEPIKVKWKYRLMLQVSSSFIYHVQLCAIFFFPLSIPLLFEVKSQKSPVLISGDVVSQVSRTFICGLHIGASFTDSTQSFSSITTTKRGVLFQQFVCKSWSELHHFLSESTELAVWACFFFWPEKRSGLSLWCHEACTMLAQCLDR